MFPKPQIDALNAVLLPLGFKIPDLYDSNFLRGLARAIKPGPAENTPDVALIASFRASFLISQNSLQPPEVLVSSIS
jgi:hypothetical protein